MSDESKTGKSVADEMRNDLRISMHLGVTPEGAKSAKKERDYLEQSIRDSLLKLTASDVFVVSLIVGALADTRVL